MKTLLAIAAALILLTSSAFSQQQDKAIHLTPENTVSFDTQVDGGSVIAVSFKLIEKVILRGTQDYPIYLVMNCPGGSVYAGEKFIQFAKTIPNLKTVTIFAASMCSAIVEGLPGERLVTEHGVMMFHRAKGSFEGQFEDGEVEQQLALWKSIVRSMEQRNANRMSLSLEEYKAKVKDEYWVFGADNVVSKVSDRLVDIQCSNELIDQGCPLLGVPYKQQQEDEEPGEE